MEVGNLQQIATNSTEKVKIDIKEIESPIKEKEEKETRLGSVKWLIEDGIIYQNPVLFAAMRDNVSTEPRQYQPDVRVTYKVNPVREMYDSNKAHK